MVRSIVEPRCLMTSEKPKGMWGMPMRMIVKKELMTGDKGSNRLVVLTVDMDTGQKS